MAKEAKKYWYLIIKDPNKCETYVSSYSDEYLARLFMLQDIMTNYSEGNIKSINIYGQNITSYKTDGYEWLIKQGYHVDGI